MGAGRRGEVVGRKVGGADVQDPLQMGAEREGRPQHLICSIAESKALGFLMNGIYWAREIHLKLFNGVFLRLDVGYEKRFYLPLLNQSHGL